MSLGKELTIRLAAVGFVGLTLAGHSAAAATLCRGVPEGEPDPAVTLCDDGSQYTFDLAGSVHTYDKARWQESLRQGITAWMSKAGVPLGSSEKAALDVFLAVPQINPQATQMRVQVSVTRPFSGLVRRFVVFTSFHPADWTFANADVGILAEEPYPDSYGYRAGSVLVKKSTAPDDELNAYVARHGGWNPEPFTATWTAYTTAVYDEAGVRDRCLKNDPDRRVLGDVRFNEIVEWIAARGVVASFPLAAQALIP